MAMTCTEDDDKTLLISHRYQEDDDDVEEEEEEEEALSLCDLPNEKGELRSIVKEEDEEFDSGFEFGIGSSFRAGSDSCEPAPEMSTADELFFKGRILPLRHSVSLDAGLNEPTRLITRSESVEFRRTGIIRSDRKIKNNFIDYSQPSPQPQIRRSSSMTARVNSIRNPKSSSIWDFLRLGLVRTPEIELRTTAGNAKLSVSRNSSCSSTSTSSNSKKIGSGESRSRNRRRSFMFSDCKCSVSTETKMAPVKIKVSSGETEEKQRMMEKKTAKKEEKSAMARKRTFEWLSQVGFVVDHGRRTLV